MPRGCFPLILRQKKTVVFKITYFDPQYATFATEASHQLRPIWISHMKRFIALAFTLTLAACGGTTTVYTTGAPVPAGNVDPTISDTGVNVVGFDPDEITVVVAPGPQTAPDANVNADFQTLINGVRLDVGTGPLAFDARLGSAAQDYAELMLETDHFGHVGPDGSEFTERVAATGYAFTALRENIAAGQPNVTAVFDAWQGSDGHRANNLATDVDEFGLGFARDGSDNRWVLILGSEG